VSANGDFPPQLAVLYQPIREEDKQLGCFVPTCGTLANKKGNYSLQRATFTSVQEGIASFLFLHRMPSRIYHYTIRLLLFYK
jgi:hypothetical protein